MKQGKSATTVTKPAAKTTLPTPATAPTTVPGGEGVPVGSTGGASEGEGSGQERIYEPMAESPFRHGEAQLAQLTGLHPRALAEARKKTAREGEHWALVKNRVAYSKQGVCLVVVYLTGPLEGDAIAGKPLTEVLAGTVLKDEDDVPPLLGTVCAFYMNTRIIGVKSGNSTIHVRVGSNKNFARGMEVPFRKMPDGHYELARKLPRTYGKW